MRIDYDIRDKFDFGLIVPAVLLIGIGLLAIYSSTSNNFSASGTFDRQLLWSALAVLIFFITYLIPTNTFKSLGIPLYFLSIALLIAVLAIGKTVSGARSWIDFGAIGFQPSELAKVGTIFAIAAYLSRKQTDIESFRDILLAIGIGIIPVMLILLEPDLGTALVFLGLILFLLFWKGISFFGLFVVLSPVFITVSSLFGIYYFFGVLLIIAVLLFVFKKDLFFSASIFALNLAAGFFTDYVYNILSPHQQRRIRSFIDPTADPLGAGYNAIQSKVAIGSGGLWGKGFMSGHQTQFQFIPEQWTDFIYCVIGEEFGFIGSVITLFLFTYLFVRILKIAGSTKDEFLSLTIAGILTVYFIHLVVNIGMTIGILPIIGIPLTFVSYGGSSLIVNMFMLGIVANVYRTRKNYT